MASSIGQGGGNYFSQINQQIAKGPDSKTAENLHHTGGTANTQRKTVVKKGVEQEEGFTFSDAAKKSLQASHQEHIEGHEHELAAHAGLQELEPENTEDHELKTKRGHERAQEEEAAKAKAGATMLPDGFVRIRNDQGIESVLAPDQVDTLKLLDGNMDKVCGRLLGDIPEANLEAAERVLDSQMKTGQNQVAKLKPVPEAQDAGRMELKSASFLGGPLDIREPGNDRGQPMTLEFSQNDADLAAAHQP